MDNSRKTARASDTAGRIEAADGRDSGNLTPLVRNLLGLLFSIGFTVWMWPRHATGFWGIPLLLPALWFGWRAVANALSRYSSGDHASRNTPTP